MVGVSSLTAAAVQYLGSSEVVGGGKVKHKKNKKKAFGILK